MMFESVTNPNGDDGELLAEGGPDATEAVEVRHLATMLPKGESRILGIMKVTMSISSATTKTFSVGEFVGLGEGEGVGEGDDAVGALQVATSDGRSLEEHPSKSSIAVPDSASDGGTGGRSSLKRTRIESEDLVASEASSISHEGLELGESVGHRQLVEVGGLDEGAEDLGEARVVDHELGDGPLVIRKLASSGELEGNGGMVAEELLVTEGRVAKKPASKSELQDEPGRGGNVQPIDASQSASRRVEVSVEGLLDLDVGVQGSLPSRAPSRGSRVFASVPSIGLREGTMMFTRSEEVEVAADNDEARGRGTASLASVSPKMISDSANLSSGEAEVVDVPVGPVELADLRGDSENSSRDDPGAHESMSRLPRGLGDEGDDTALVLAKTRLVGSRGEGAEHVEVLEDGVQEATMLLGGAMNFLKSENREGTSSTRNEGSEEAKLVEPGVGSVVVKSAGIPGDEVDRRALGEPGGQEATQTTGRSRRRRRTGHEQRSWRGSSRGRSRPERQQGGAT